MGRLADLDAITLDANGTLVGLVDPVPVLERTLKEQGVERSAEAIRHAVEAEGVVYAGRALEAHDPATFAVLQRECTGVFLGELRAEALDAGEFAPYYVAAMQFEVLPGARDALKHLRESGLELAVVANFDLTLAERLDQLDLVSWFSAVVTPADAGAAKPDPAIFEYALRQLNVFPERALHIGDRESDQRGARAAGMHFAWAPVTEALEQWR